MNESMGKVMKSSSDMIGIIGIINDISDRINLLSLNASIEAARAGEAGRGFAVVAEEISKLADQTATSTKNIDDLIRANSSEISMEMRNLDETTVILKKIIEGVDRMKNEVRSISSVAGEQLETAEKVRLHSADIYARANEILETAGSQKENLDTITSSISNINDYTNNITAGAEEIAASAGDISGMAETLNEKISQFKI
jgi:methyl-accepting chemotaxis protein